MANRILTEQGYQTLKRELDQLRRTCSNLKNRLATIGVRRHQGGGGMPPGVFFGKTTGSLAQGGSVTINPIVWNGSAFEVDTSTTKTVHDVFLNATETLDSGTVVAAFRYQGKLVVGPMYCVPNDVF